MFSITIKKGEYKMKQKIKNTINGYFTSFFIDLGSMSLKQCCFLAFHETEIPNELIKYEMEKQ